MNLVVLTFSKLIKGGSAPYDNRKPNLVLNHALQR